MTSAVLTVVVIYFPLSLLHLTHTHPPAAQFIQLHSSPDNLPLSSSLLSQLELATHNLLSSASIDRYTLPGRKQQQLIPVHFSCYCMIESKIMWVKHACVIVDTRCVLAAIWLTYDVQINIAHLLASQTYTIFMAARLNFVPLYCQCQLTTFIHIQPWYKDNIIPSSYKPSLPPPLLSLGVVWRQRSAGLWSRVSATATSFLPAWPSSPPVPERGTGCLSSVMRSSMLSHLTM